jgi:hypothetical protein
MEGGEVGALNFGQQVSEVEFWGDFDGNLVIESRNIIKSKILCCFL